MITRSYVADFYGGLPKKGQAPELSIEVKAHSNMSALHRATHKAYSEGHNFSYVVIRKKE